MSEEQWTHVVVALGPGQQVTIEHCTSEGQATLVTQMLAESLNDPAWGDGAEEMGPNIYMGPICPGAQTYRYDENNLSEGHDPWYPA